MPVEKRILQQNRPALRLLGLAVATGFLAAVLFIAQALFISQVVNRVFLEAQTLADVLPLLAIMLALLLIRAGFIWLGDVLAQRAASRVKGNLREQLTGHLFLLGPAYTRTQRSGELVNTLVEGIEALDEYFTQYLPARFLAALVPAMVFLVVLVLDPWSTLVLLFAGPMLLMLLVLIGGQTKALSERRFVELSWMSAHFLDMLQGLPTLKIFGRSRDQGQTIADISRQFGNTTMDVLRTAFQTSLVLEWAATAATALVALEVSLRLMNGLLPFYTALAVLLLTPEFFIPLRQYALRYHAGSAGKAATTRIFAILDTPAPQPGPVQHIDPPAPGPQFSIRFKQVSFAYDNGQRPALQDFNLDILHGQTVALVGSTGAGKTTVSNLLLRFIAPNSGEITVDGVPLQNIAPDVWRTQVAWVSQQPYLFHGTIADNLRLARPNATPDNLIIAAKAAHAHDFIEALPQGYNTPLGERGARLSGGQQQRLAIARAFLKDAPFLILDEVTSHLDSRSEALIQDGLARLMQGRTVLIIAHRMKLAYSANQIVVMSQGRAVETGQHAHLLAQNGVYRQLVDTFEGSAA